MHREFFPVTRNLIYLNHAAVTPLCRPAAEAMQSVAQDALDWGSLHYDRWLECYEGLRRSAARLIKGTPEEIAIVKNTSEGIATVAMGLDWRTGDKIVAFEGEFPANQYPWQRLESKGVKIEWLPPTAPLDRIDQAARGARLLSISFVQFLSGFRADLSGIGEICHRNGLVYLVDAIQGLGAFPVDVQAAHIDALAADGHKWLVGPEGCGILHISRRLQEQVEPMEFGWTNVAGYNDYASRDMTLRPDAGRYECGTLNTIGCYGLRASIDFLLGIGIDKISPVVRGLATQIVEGARKRGYEVLGEPNAGIVSFRKPDLDSATICARLRDRAIVTAQRAGWVRASPHFYVEAEDIDKMLDLLP
jgi:cysteine desulfurase/selenocysteine lyase